MKTQYVIKPLTLALAAVLSAGTYANDRDHRHQYNGADASIRDSQNIHNNSVRNEGTKNTASVKDSLGNASGNVGVNVAAGDDNQQANAAAIATADAALVFGRILAPSSAKASVTVTQEARNNTLNNYSAQNNASLSNSANGTSGNVGINIAAGNFNQQKNDTAIAVSENALVANANSSISQSSHRNTTNNNATLDYGSQKVTLSGGFGGGYIGSGVGGYVGRESGTTKGTSDQIGNVYPDSWSGVSHASGYSTGHFDLDTDTQGGSDLNGDGGALAFGEKGTYKGTEKGVLGFVEAGGIGLKGSVTGNIPVVAGFKAPVVNNASVDGSLNRVSGNVGVNVASGGGNQQSNSLTLAAGCNACAGSL